NTGGSTDTFGLVFTGPAFDHSPSSARGCAGTDQRDVTRPQGGSCDIAAYEFAVPVEGNQCSGALVTGTCGPASPTINWGDGTGTHPGTLGGPGGDQISGTHKYRSEEHTSELQSQSNLVCRLL